MGIFCVGQAVYDITVPYTGPLRANQKYRIAGARGCSGAPALNAACLCALWGAPVELIARIGTDPYGLLVQADLARYGVGTTHLLIDEQTNTGFSVIAVDDATGDRTIFNVPPAMHEGAFNLPSERPQVILSDGHEPVMSLALMEAFPEAHSVVDAGTYRASTYDVARAADYVVCSEDFARQYTGSALEDADNEHAIDELLVQIEGINNGVAVVTLGARGLVYRDEQGHPRHMPAYKAHAVDTTGAGDIFHGAFSYGLYAGRSLEENLLWSSMASSLSVRSMGGLTSIPTFHEVEKALSATP